MAANGFAVLEQRDVVLALCAQGSGVLYVQSLRYWQVVYIDGPFARITYVVNSQK